MDEDKEISIQILNEKFPAALEYIKEIFLIHRDYGMVKNSVLAKRLAVSKPAVTQAMKRLNKYNLIEQDLYGSICLTSAGRLVAAKVLKRHYLIEHLLIRSLDYPWVKSDEEASRIQASLSDEFTEYLFEKMGRPETCPHGNPFPGSASEKEILSALRLNTVSFTGRSRIVRITEEGEAEAGLLQFCYENNLRPGRELEIISREEGVTVVTLGGASKIRISDEYARYICID